MKAALLVILLLISGCATIQEHPYATGVAVAIVAGSIIASTHHDNQGGGPIAMANVNGPKCTGSTCQ